MNITGWFQSIGYDSLAGIFCLVLYNYLSFLSRQQFPTHSHILPVDAKNQSNASMKTPGIPPLFEDPSYESLPWKVSLYRLKALCSESSYNATMSPSNTSSLPVDVGVGKNGTSTVQHVVVGDQRELERVALSTRRTALFLFLAYRWTGQLAHTCEGMLYRMAGLGVPMTVAMHRSLAVLLSHLSWVLMGTFILSADLHPDFFGRNRERKSERKHFLPRLKRKETSFDSQNCTKTNNSKWYTNEWNTSWVWWVVGGYLISAWLFNIADMVNQLVLPASVFEHAGEGVVAQLISPENNDILASIVGYIAPCLTAPIWEELLYRGFMLPALCLFMPFWAAIVVSGFVFSAHHMSVTGFIPLMVLGMAWATLYAKCRNLLVTILIHAMWNSRVFIGSWLGF
jgi:membrane protease YdiL (CAAX protease family)